MPRKNKSKGNKPRAQRHPKQGLGSLAGPPVTAIRYNGPTSLVSSDVLTQTVQISNCTLVTGTSSGGVASFAPVITADSVTGVTDFAEQAALWQEYRVLAVEVEYMPTRNQPMNAAVAGTIAGGVGYGQVVTPMVLARYHDDPTALSDYNNAYQHASKVCFPLHGYRPHKIACRMSETQEAQWTNTAAVVSALFGVKVWAGWETIGATDVVRWGYINAVYTVQFRGRAITPTQMRVLVNRAASESRLLFDEKKQPSQQSSVAECRDALDCVLVSSQPAAAAAAAAATPRQPLRVTAPSWFPRQK